MQKSHEYKDLYFVGNNKYLVLIKSKKHSMLFANYFVWGVGIILHWRGEEERTGEGYLGKLYNYKYLI